VCVGLAAGAGGVTAVASRAVDEVANDLNNCIATGIRLNIFTITDTGRKT
jgi:hypothetical protein